MPLRMVDGMLTQNPCQKAEIRVFSKIGAARNFPLPPQPMQTRHNIF